MARPYKPRAVEGKIMPDDPKICDILFEHLKEGWSPQSFAGKVAGGSPTYYRIRETNKLFDKLCAMCTPVTHRRFLNKFDCTCSKK